MLNLTINYCKIPNVMKMVENVCLLHDKDEMYADEAFQSKQDNLGKLSNGFFLDVKRFVYRNRRVDYLSLLSLWKLSQTYNKVMNSSQEIIGNDMEWPRIEHIVNLIATKK